MAYCDFTLDLVEQRLGVRAAYASDLFGEAPELPPPTELQRHLNRWAPEAKAINTEIARSSLIVTPILATVVDHLTQTGVPVALFLGTQFDVDKSRGLFGSCDFLLTRSESSLTFRRPVLAVVEAKKDDITSGLGPCAAEMVAAQQFNQSDSLAGSPAPPTIYGAVTTGSAWGFLRLDGATLRVDRTEYFLVQLPKLLGILRAILL